jgi:integrase
VLSSAVKDRPLVRVKDLPACGQTVELWWRKRRLLCGERLCPRRSFTQIATAVKDGRMVRNVAEDVPLPRVLRRKKRFLTHEQVAQLAEACAPYQTLIRVLAYSGLRWGEVAALRVHRVDLLRRRLEVDEANTEVGGRVVQGTTKNHQRRSVPIPRFLADQLAEHLVSKKPDDLVFTSPAGGVLRNASSRCSGMPLWP